MAAILMEASAFLRWARRAYSLRFGRDLDLAQVDEFIGMYVNERTLAYGEDGHEAVRLFLNRAWEAGFLPEPSSVDFVR